MVCRMWLHISTGMGVIPIWNCSELCLVHRLGVGVAKSVSASWTLLHGVRRCWGSNHISATGYIRHLQGQSQGDVGHAHQHREYTPIHVPHNIIFSGKVAITLNLNRCTWMIHHLYMGFQFERIWCLSMCHRRKKLGLYMILTWENRTVISTNQNILDKPTCIKSYTNNPHDEWYLNQSYLWNTELLWVSHIYDIYNIIHY